MASRATGGSGPLAMDDDPEDRLLAQAAEEPKPLPPALRRRRRRRSGHIPRPAASPPRGTAPPRAAGGSHATSAPAVAPDPGRTGESETPPDDASRVAWLSRTRARQASSRRADRDGLVAIAAGRDVAPANRTGLVVVRRRRGSSLHTGAAGRRRGRRLLRGDQASRCGHIVIGPVLGVERRRRSARDADAQQRSRLHARRDRNPERARRRQRRRRVVAQRGVRHRREDSVLGHLGLAADRRRRRRRRRVRRGSSPTTARPAAALARKSTGGSYSSPHLVTIDGVSRCC